MTLHPSVMPDLAGGLLCGELERPGREEQGGTPCSLLGAFCLSNVCPSVQQTDVWSEPCDTNALRSHSPLHRIVSAESSGCGRRARCLADGGGGTRERETEEVHLLGPQQV